VYCIKACFLLLILVSSTHQQLPVPGARTGAISWIDKNGDLWLFGGEGFGSSEVQTGRLLKKLKAIGVNTILIGLLNDLWKYEQSINQWIWVSGNNMVNQQGIYGSKGIPSQFNMPGARSNSISWVDFSGTLWLFGGLGYDSQTFGNYIKRQS
jgi:hypothetical protein